MSMKQYIIEFNNNQSLMFDLYDSQLVVNLEELTNSINSPKYIGHGIFKHYDSISEPHARILKSKDQLAQLGINVEWPDNASEITRDLLNYLHLEFHKIAEGNHDVNIKKIFGTINYDIHQLEELVVNKGNNSHYVIVHVNNEPGHLPKCPLETNNYLKEFQHKYIEDAPDTMLVLGYATIGKHLGHCVVDNDIEAVKSKHLSPQIHMTTEVIVRHCTPIEHLWQEDKFNKQSEQRIIDWVDNNNLGDYVDINDKRNLITIQPVIGQICEQQRNITEHDLWQRFRNDTIKTIRITT